MSQFTTPLIGSYNDDMTLFTITEKFCYQDRIRKPYTLWCVPNGFVTDFASIPKWLHWLMPPIGRYGKAAVIHDYLYVNAIESKEYADNIFYDAMLVLKVSKWKAKIMYLGVKLGGKGNYV